MEVIPWDLWKVFLEAKNRKQKLSRRIGPIFGPAHVTLMYSDPGPEDFKEQARAVDGVGAEHPRTPPGEDREGNQEAWD